MKSTLAIIAISAILLSGLAVLPGARMSNAYSLPTTSSHSPMTMNDINFVLNGPFQQVAAQSSPTGKTHNITLIATEKNLTLPDGQKLSAFTWNGTVPGPTIRVTQGDLINLHVVNNASNKNIHSNDMHASTISAVPNFGPINISKSKDYSFVAQQPGFFKYHCEGNGVLTMDQHVFQGMVGGVIVDPIGGYTPYVTIGTDNKTGKLANVEVGPKAKEVTMQFSEYYLDKDGNYNQTAMFAHQPTGVWINGIPFGYDPVVTKTKNATPLFFKQGDHVRFFLLNHGDWPVNFHIVGEQLDRVTDGSVVNGIGKQTYMVGGSNDAIVDVYFDKPGVYAPVNHDYAQLFKGQASFIVVDPVNSTATSDLLKLKDQSNPSNAIPPVGPQTDPVKTKPYCLGGPCTGGYPSS